MNAHQNIPDPSRHTDLSGRIASASATVFMLQVTLRLIGLLNTFILARILLPDDFGLVAIGISVLQLIQNLTDIGVSQTVIRYQNPTDTKLNTIFTLSLLRGIAIAIVLILIALNATFLFQDPRVQVLILGLSIIPLLHAGINPKYFQFEGQLDFTKEFFTGVTEKMLGVVVSVTIALIWQTYLAIVFGLIAGTLVKLILSYFLLPFRPRLTLASFSEIWGFTGWLGGVSFVTSLNNKLDVIMMGRILGPTPTGIFYIADQLAGMASTEIASPIARALYPGLSQIQADSEAMLRLFLRSTEVLGATALPAGIGFAFVADTLIVILLGQRWAETIPIIQILAPVFGLTCCFSSMYAFAVAKGMTRALCIREIIFFMIKVPLFLWATLNYGLMGAAYAVFGNALIHFALSLLLFGKISGQPFWLPIWRIRRSFAACLLMALSLLILSPVFSNIPMSLILVKPLAQATIGVSIFALVHYVLWSIEGRPPGIEADALQLGRSLTKPKTKS